MNSPFRRWPLTSGVALMLAVALLVLGFGLWGLEPVLDLLLKVDDLVQAHYSTALALFILSFIVLAALALPIGSLYCLTAGYLFGVLTGAAASLVASLIAALLSFLLIRHLTGPALRQRLGQGRLAGLMLILERDVNWYLVLLRVVPIAPFFLINAAAAITQVSTRHFVIASFAGLLPSTLIYASLGAGIGSVLEARDMMGPELLLQPDIALPLAALTALIIASWLLKRRLQQRIQRRMAR